MLMETVLELQKIIVEKEPGFSANPDFVKLREFYEEMKRRGLATKQEYSLPPLDTTGQGLYQAQQDALRCAE
jgi:hypothetical protein